MGIEVVAKNHLQPPKTMFLPQINLKILIQKFHILHTVQHFLCHPDVIRMSFVCARILSIYARMPFLCHSYVFVCHLYVIRMYLYVMVRHSYVLVCYPHVTRIYSYVMCISFICTRMSSVCYSYVLLRDSHVTRM